MKFPIIPCDLCGSQDGLQRNAMKAMLTDIETRMPGRKDTMIRALTNARPSHLLDRRLFDFRGPHTGGLTAWNMRPRSPIRTRTMAIDPVMK